MSCLAKSFIVGYPQLPRDELGRATSAILTGDYTLAADAKWKYIDILPEKSQLTSEAQGELPSQTQLNKLVAVHPGVGAEASATGTTSTTINVEATDEVPAPFFVGTLEPEDGDIDCSNGAATSKANLLQ